VSAVTRAERQDLLKVARQRERVAETGTTAYAAKLIADFEQQLASIYSFGQSEVWRKVAEAADKAVEAANADLAEECQKLGIPKRFAPGIALQWYGRGENAVASRRAEARAKIEQASLDVQPALLAIGMSAEAQELLAKMPTAEQLMPAVTVTEAEALLEWKRR
jgi:hypothetical protein